MDHEAFVAGLTEVLSKEGVVNPISWVNDNVVKPTVDWTRHNVFQPVAQGTIDRHYGGVGTYNADTGHVDANIPNTIRAISGATPASQAPSKDSGWARRVLYRIGRTNLGKRMTNFIGADDAEIGQRMSKSTSGVLGLGEDGLKVDRSKVPQMLWDQASNWVSNNKGKVGLGLGLLTAGAMLGRRQQPAAPAGQQAAPYTTAPNKSPGREGNTFTNYKELD